ncbi:MAG: hypothetical protein NZL89_04610 [Leptospiraceae bacterium]|nr:hypothetical protein [Leptospiraceae bacterium]
MFQFAKIAVLVVSLQPILATPLAQAIFDEESETSEEAPAEDEPKGAVEKSAEKSKDEKAVEKKAKGKKKRKKRAIKAQTSEQKAPSPDYSPENLARQSYNWIPEPMPALKTVPAGLQKKVLVIPTPQPEGPAETEKPAPKSFRWPQIPLTQLLIVAAFVFLFLLYRFRVARQPRRKRY